MDAKTQQLRKQVIESAEKSEIDAIEKADRQFKRGEFYSNQQTEAYFDQKINEWKKEA